MTPKQHQLLRFIRNCIVHLGKSPTYQEMKAFMGMKASSNQAIDDLLTGLEKENYITRGGKMRGIKITGKGLGHEETFVLQTEKSVPSSQLPSCAGNTSTAGDYQISFSQVTGVNSLLFTSGKLFRKGGEKDGSTTS